MINERCNIKVIAFDLDGTIYNGNQIIDGAFETIDFFRSIGKEIVFFTNNSSQSRSQIFNKLSKFSINLQEKNVYCCSYAFKVYLKTENYKNVFIVGSDTLKEELSGLGINIVNDRTYNEVDAMLIGMDLDFNYSRLASAYEVLQRNQRCKIIVSNVDPSFPVEKGLRKPGCGAIVSSILTAANRDYDFMVGKPDSFILTIIGKEKNVPYEKILVIGDSYDSDILMAKNANAHSILIDAFRTVNTEKTITVESIKEVQEIFKRYFV